MPRKKKDLEVPKIRPATTPEAREKQLISLAVDLAEQQMRDGTASSAVIVHYLKLGSSRGRLENEMLEKKTSLVEAQTESMQATKHIEELYSEALNAMRLYSGQKVEDDTDEY